MYQNTKVCVKIGDGLTDIFICTVGMRQGWPLSPLLNCIYINNLDAFLQNERPVGCRIGDMTYTILLFADDAILLSESREELQHLLDKLKQYCSKWGLR